MAWSPICIVSERAVIDAEAGETAMETAPVLSFFEVVTGGEASSEGPKQVPRFLGVILFSVLL